MHKITRPSLAALVCPSAPFLAPRLLRSVAAVTPDRLPSAGSAAYATATREKNRMPKSHDDSTSTQPGRSRHAKEQTEKSRAGKKEKATVRDVSGSKNRWTDSVRGEELKLTSAHVSKLIDSLRQACETRNVQQVMDMYPALLEAGVLCDVGIHARRIAQALHVRLRHTVNEEERTELLAFAREVTADMRREAVAPHHLAYVHLLGIYKDCACYEEGHALWQWLVDQDDRHVSAAAYGAAIELLAYGHRLALPDLEIMYAEALTRFPGTFAAYHLSPDAIVPDRTQPTLIPGIPMILLQGILTARILARDWRNAYLALHVALRLYPAAVPARFFELFMAERPLAEAYAAYMLACRAGVVIRHTHVTALFTKMRVAIGALHSMADRVLLVRALANALYASLEAGGELQSIYVGVLIQSMTQLLPENAQQQHVTTQETELRHAIVNTVLETMSGLTQAGFKPQIHPYNALVVMAGKYNLPELLTTTLQQIEAAGIQLGPISVREAITAAGYLGNTSVIEQLWGTMIKESEAQCLRIRSENWVTLAKACRRANHQQYFEQQMYTLAHMIQEGAEKRIRGWLNRPDTVPEPMSFQFMALKDFSSKMKGLKSQMANVEAVLMSGQPLDILQTPFHMHLNPQQKPLGSVEDLRAVYDQCSTDPHQPPPPPPVEGGSVPVPTSPTKIPLDELRFRNWVTIFEMMSDAEAYETDREIHIKRAAAAGMPVEGNPELLRLHDDASVTHSTIISLSTRIASLRSAKPVDAPRYRYVVNATPNTIDTPMTYDESQGKWRMRSGRLVKYMNPPQKSDLHPMTVTDGALKVPTLSEIETAREAPIKAPTLSYYIGMRPDHVAPEKKQTETTIDGAGVEASAPQVPIVEDVEEHTTDVVGP